MSLLNRTDRRLIALSGDTDHEAFVGRSIRDLLDQRAVLLGRVIQLETEKISDQYRAGQISDRERDVLHDELRSAWSRIAAGHGDIVKYTDMLNIGRGTA